MKHLSKPVKAFFFCTAFLWVLPLVAQERTPLSLEQAIQFAVTNNRQLQAAYQLQDAAKRGIGQARAALFPRLDIIEGFTYTDKPTLVFSSLLDQSSFKQRNFAIGSLNEPTPITNLSSQIRLEQPLYAGGRLLANLRQAEAGADASNEMTKRTRHEVIARAVEAYYNVLLTEGNLAVVDKALLSSRSHLKRAKDLFDTGLVVRSDFLRTQVLVGSLERERLEAENALMVTRSGLRHVLGVEEESFRLTETVKADDLPIEGLETLIARAKEHRPDLNSSERETEGAAQRVREAEADFYPSLGLITQFEGNTRKFSTSAENFAVFVTAKLNLFNGFATREKVQEAQALLRRARLLHDDLSQAVALEVEQAYLGLSASRKQVTVAKENVAQADESLRILRDRYSAGLTRNIEVVDGETALKKAEQDLLQAQVSSQILRARLNLATGEL